MYLHCITNKYQLKPASSPVFIMEMRISQGEVVQELNNRDNENGQPE
tara:strand:- start:379 stop:519 length:141 start_codon:yes stop_codon:yes gene_type:complete